MTDYLILLLSTDWFLPYWTEFGIAVDEKTKAKIQLGCREIVAQILQGAESYYFIDFSADRRQATNSLFVALLQAYGAQPAVFKTYDQWLGFTHEKLSSSTLYASITTRLVVGTVDEGQPELNSGTRDLLAKTWRKYRFEASFFPEKSLESDSQWDIYTCGIFDPPDAMGNQAWAVLLSHRFEAFWMEVRQQLASAQLNELKLWYRLMTQHLLNEERPDLIPECVE